MAKAVAHAANLSLSTSLGRQTLRMAGTLLTWGAVAVLLLQVWYFVHIGFWAMFNPTTTSFMRLRLDELQQLEPDATLHKQWVPYHKISNSLKRAVIAAEDSNFMQHHGIDWPAIQKAMQRNQQRGRVTHGGSTITQQLAKNLFLSPKRSYLRKGQELVITYMIEALWSKRRILEVYLNVVEWGNGVYGAQAAAQHHFGVPAHRLSPAQAARLAAMLPAPRFFDRRPNSPYLARKTQTIQARMAQHSVP